MKAWLGKKRWSLEGTSFGLRLFLTLALTLCVTGAFQYVITSRETRDQLLDEAASRAQADTILVQQAFDSETDTVRRTDLINMRLEAISRRAGVRYVLLVDRYGVINNASDKTLIGKYHGSSQAREVMQSGQVATSLIDDDGVSYYRYRVPVEIPTGRFVLEVEQDAETVERQVADAKRSSLFIAASGIAVGAALFFLFGGRSLSRMHHQAQRMSSRDGLTGLENHITFNEALEQMTGLAARHRAPLSLALIDIDDFKLVNDRLGHRQGDDVIKRVSSMLITGRLGDRAFRVGGDEFAILFPSTDEDGAYVATERLWRTAVAHLEGVTMSVGVASLEPGMTHTDLQDHADHALYEAKRRGRNNVVSFENVKDDTVVSSDKVRAVRRLIEDEQLGTAFQPIWDLHGERPFGFEALARPLPEYGLSGPAELFQIGERIGRTQQLDALSWQWALERAKELPDDVLLFLNVSPFTADKGNEPVDRLIEVVRASGRDPSAIVIEITERWSKRRDLVIEQAERLRAAGFLLALDDVGAGSGDLEMMSRLPVDFIKIDLAVVKAARTDTRARGVFFAIAAFAAHCGSTVIAEGIENEDVLSFVQSAGENQDTRTVVRGGQGYYLGRPVEGPPTVTPAPYRPLEAQGAISSEK